MPRTSYAIAALLVTLLLGVVTSSDAAKIKCWRNKDGIRECGNSVPPEYVQQGHEERSSAGFTVRKQNKARDKAEIEAARRSQIEAKKAAEEAKKRREAQTVKDRVLLDTFVSEQDLILAHRHKKEAITQRTQHSANHVIKLEDILDEMQTQAANQERAGTPINQALLHDISDVQRQIQETEAFIKGREEEQIELDKHHQADLKRFRYLKSGGAIGSKVHH